MAERIRILSVPYDCGLHNIRMGRGPIELLGYGLTDRIRDADHDVAITTIDHGLPVPSENTVAFQMHELLGNAVRDCRAEGAFPLILSGNCNYAAIGAVTGLGVEETGVLWFDAHGESETPETTRSAFLDGMGLAMLTGGCWTQRLGDMPGFSPLDPQRAVLVGARDLSEAEQAYIGDRNIGRVTVEDICTTGAAALTPELDRLGALGVRRLYVHVDADVYDPDNVGHANHFSATAGTGLTAEELTGCLSAIYDAIPIQAAAITAYDPSVDPSGRMRGTLTALAVHLSGLGRI